jgi:hypothetical protein
MSFMEPDIGDLQSIIYETSITWAKVINYEHELS